MNSLRIDENFLVALVDGDPRAAAIADSWKFRFPVTEMTSDEIDALYEKCRTTLAFSRSEDASTGDIAYE